MNITESDPEIKSFVGVCVRVCIFVCMRTRGQIRRFCAPQNVSDESLQMDTVWKARLFRPLEFRLCSPANTSHLPQHRPLITLS